MFRTVCLLTAGLFALACAVIAPRPPPGPDPLAAYARFMPGQPMPYCASLYAPPASDVRLCEVELDGARVYLTARDGVIVHTTIGLRLPLAVLVSAYGRPVLTLYPHYGEARWEGVRASLRVIGFASLRSTVLYVSFNSFRKLGKESS